MNVPGFEQTRPDDYLMRLAASDLGRAYKSLAVSELGSRDAQAADKILGLSRVTGRAVSAGYLTEETAGQWLDHLASRPFFGSLTLFIVTAVAIDPAS